MEVSKDIAKEARLHPLKTLVYFLSGGMLLAAWEQRPDSATYINDVLEYANELAQCSEVVRNPHSQAYIERIAQLYSDDCLRYVNCGFFAIMMQRPHNPRCKNYHLVCKHLQPSIRTADQRVVDVGWWGRWYVLEREMVDFDVNEEELEKSLQKQ